MAKIHINNPKQVINGGAKKYYFKVKGLGGPKGDKGDKGDTGATGPQGPQGNAATISVGSTTTLPVGYDATVENVGSIYNAVLNFGIPQGPQGPQGATGAKGDKGDKGDQGNPGPQGEKGTNATVYVGTTSTLNPGSQATVYNSGTDSNAVLNFGIPKGEKGDTGPMPTIAQSTGQVTDQVMSQKATTDALNTKQATITSSNKLSADLVDDTSTTNKFVTASDITNWNGKQDALTAGTGIDITGGVISTPAIVPEVVAELPTTGAEGKLYLTPKAHTTSTATGNPIEATITDEAGQIESFQLDGDTYQQTYTGKNLFDKENYNILNCWPTSTIAHGNNWSIWIPCEPNTTYSVTKMICQPTSHNRFKIATTAVEPDYGVTVVDSVYPANDSTIGKITTGATANYLMVVLANTDTAPTTTLTEMLSSVQIEKGSTATDYEPFVGGQPSPNPSYPQQIQTVTGTQTISINGTDYPIDLGSLELCKLSTYQDYIYKDDDDWKVHKATVSAIIDGSENWDTSGTNTFYVANIYSKIGNSIQSASTGEMYASHFTIVDITSSNTLVGASLRVDAAHNVSNLRIRLQDMSGGAAGFRQMLSAKKPSIYARRLTPTDTIITDQTLIAQLEAIRTAALESGSNTISNTATGTNLAGDMEIGYYGFNPTNRYDKFIWLNLNNNYEQIGGE